MSESLIQVNGVSKSFGSFKALDNVSLEINSNEIFGLLGPNGAGKSTLFSVLTGIGLPDSGKISFEEIAVKKNSKLINSMIGVVPQEISCYHEFSVFENLDFCAELYNVKNKKERIEFLLKWLNLIDFRDKRIEQLSGGYKRLANIALGIIHDPKIVFFDEATVGLDPGMRQLIWRKIKELKARGKTIIMTTHYLDEAQELCDRCAILVSGRVLAIDSPNLLIEKYGGERIAIVKCNKLIDSNITLSLKKVFPKESISVEDNYLVASLSKKQSLEKISAITELLLKQGYEITSSVIKEPDLEDVFLRLAGKKIELEKAVK